VVSLLRILRIDIILQHLSVKHLCKGASNGSLLLCYTKAMTTPMNISSTNAVLPQGFLSPDSFHKGQWEGFLSKARVTVLAAGQGGGKTIFGYWWTYRNMSAYPGESHLIGFPDYGLLNRVITNQPDPDRFTLIQFLSYMGEDPLLHIQDRWIECRAGTKSRIFFASGNDLVGWEGAHVKSAWIDEFDECPVGAYRRAMERTSMRR